MGAEWGRIMWAGGGKVPQQMGVYKPSSLGRHVVGLPPYYTQSSLLLGNPVAHLVGVDR